MTYEEAIMQLEFCKKHIEPMTDEFMQALNIAIEALQKQAPMKPLIFDSVPHARCPQCHSAIRLFCDDEYPEQCDCGQRIDWSDD